MKLNVQSSRRKHFHTCAKAALMTALISGPVFAGKDHGTQAPNTPCSQQDQAEQDASALHDSDEMIIEMINDRGENNSYWLNKSLGLDRFTADIEESLIYTKGDKFALMKFSGKSWFQCNLTQRNCVKNELYNDALRILSHNDQYNMITTQSGRSIQLRTYDGQVLQSSIVSLAYDTAQFHDLSVLSPNRQYHVMSYNSKVIKKSQFFIIVDYTNKKIKTESHNFASIVNMSFEKQNLLIESQNAAGETNFQLRSIPQFKMIRNFGSRIPDNFDF